MPLPTNIAGSYPDRGPGDTAHQEHHDVIHAAVNEVTEGRLSESGLNAAFATRGQVRSKVKTDGTDQTATLQAELDGIVAAGGGTLLLPVGTITLAGTITLDNNAATPVPHHGPVKIEGQGTRWAARSIETPIGGTVLDIKGTDTYGKVKDNAVGLLAIEGVTFMDSAGTATPFLYTTNATLHVTHCGFIGSKSGLSCDQDAIILGGVNQVEGGSGWTDGFQGYGTVIAFNYFQRVRRAVLGRSFANAVRVVFNTVWALSGNPNGAAIEWDGQPGTGGQWAAGGTVGWNLIECLYYKYGIEARYTIGMSFLDNDCYDPGSQATAAIHLESTAYDCKVKAGYFPGTLPYLIDDVGGSSFEEMNGSNNRSVTSRPAIHRGVQILASQGGNGAMSATSHGNYASVKAIDPPSGLHPYSRVSIVTSAATQVADAVLTNGSRTLTSATAAFVASDKDLPIGGAGLPSNTYIAKVVDASTVELTNAATTTATGVTVDIGRLNTQVEQIGFNKSHVTGKGNAPTATVTAAAGSGATVSVSGTDLSGSITVTTGTAPTTGVLVNVVNAATYMQTQRPVIAPANEAAATVGVWADRSNASGWRFGAAVAPPASTALKFNYIATESA